MRHVRRWLSLVGLWAITACGVASSSSDSSGGATSGGRTDSNSGGAGAATGGTLAATGGTLAGTGGASVASGAGGATAGNGGATAGNGGATAGSGSGGTMAGNGGSTDPNTGAGAGGGAEPCLEVLAPRHASGTVLEFPIHLTLNGAPLRFAEANPVASGGTLTPLDFRFYMSEIALLRNGAEPVPVDVVTSAGAMAAYGVYFFNADDPAATTLSVRAPQGEYSGITFLFGLTQACNTRAPELMKAPLSATSQMTWPHSGYLFLRYQGRSMLPDPGSAEGGAGGGGPGDPALAFPPVIHMGGALTLPLAPVVRVEGPLSVPAMGLVSKNLQVALDEIFKGALSDVDLTGFVGPPGEEVLLGERLRRTLPTLHVFSLAQ